MTLMLIIGIPAVILGVGQGFSGRTKFLEILAHEWECRLFRSLGMILVRFHEVRRRCREMTDWCLLPALSVCFPLPGLSEIPPNPRDGS